MARPRLRLSVIALLSSLGQAVTAVALVYTGVSLLHLGRERMISLTEAIMAPVSYGAIACVGLWLFWRGLRHFRATLPTPQDHHHHHHHHYYLGLLCITNIHLHQKMHSMRHLPENHLLLQLNLLEYLVLLVVAHHH